jgi:hypothetical protein
MQISATLLVSGDLLDPDEVTKILNVTPHASKRKGDVKNFKFQKSIVAKFGLWEWRSRDPSGELTVNDHVSAIANTFAPVYDALLGLPNAENTWIDLHFFSDDSAEDVSSVEFLMSPETIAVLCKTGLPVEVTISALSSAQKKA